MRTVAIIGAGQLGSRHLQALANVDTSLTIYVADINNESLSTARSRFDEVKGTCSHEVYYINEISALPSSLDIVIVATNSIIRKKVIEELLAGSEVKHLILEKFLFPRKSDYVEVAPVLADRPEMKVWVNCPRRTFDLYKRIATELKDQGPVNVTVTGSGWGLGCNSIHFVDIFSFIVNQSEVTVLSEAIDDEYTESKRQGYVEFSGSLYLGAVGGHRMEVTSYKTGSHPIIIKISTPTACWIINETAREYEYASAANDWVFVKEKVSFPMQSQVGTQVANDLIRKGYCELASYATSASLHLALLQTFIDKFNLINKESKDLCPIT